MIHLQNVIENKRLNLLYVIEEDDERNEEIKNSNKKELIQQCQFLNSSQTYRVLNDTKLDMVIITTPTQTHQELVLRSLKAGKSVFCEKPIANKFEDVKKCYELSEKLNIPLFCAFNRRFDPSFNNIKNRVSNSKKELGNIQIIKTCSRDSPLPSISYLTTSNGIFHDCAVHDIDLICWIMGGYPDKVYATGFANNPSIKEINDHDTVAINMEFKKFGSIGLIDISRFANYGYDQRLEVFGQNGMLSCNNQYAIHVDKFSSIGGGGGNSSGPIYYSFASRYADAYKFELDHFVDVVEGKAVMMVNKVETLSVCKVASACEESARTGQPVTINYDDDDF